MKQSRRAQISLFQAARAAPLLGLASALWSVPVTAQDASEAYRSQFQLSGFIMRSATVCDAGKKSAIGLALDLIKRDELKTLAKAYPSTTEKWMMEGSANFNTGVMQDGLKAACKFAYETRAKAARIISGR